MELDAIYHQANWEPLRADRFRARLAEQLACPGWVVDGNYASLAGDLVWPRADTVLFLDPPRWRVMTQLLGRTLRRGFTREVLWNGNRERLSNLVSVDPRKNLLLWSWTRHRLYQERFEAARRDPAWAHIEFRRLSNRADMRVVLGAAGVGDPSP